MHRRILRAGLGIGTCLILSASVVLAKDGSNSIEQQMTTSSATSFGSGNGSGSVFVQRNTGGNVQSSNPSFLNIDNLKEFESTQNKEINDFRKRKMDELKQKTQQIRDQRKTCTDKVKSLMEQRRQQRLELLKNCSPTFSTAQPTNAPEAKARAQEVKQLMISCKQKIIDFEKETKKELLNVRTQCFNTERTVLGLSTRIPWNR